MKKEKEKKKKKGRKKRKEWIRKTRVHSQRDWGKGVPLK